MPVTLSQDSFRFRNDDGSEAGATWIKPTNGVWTPVFDFNFRLRFLISRPDESPQFNGILGVFFSYNGAAFETVSDSTVIHSVPSPNFEDGDDTTQQLGSALYISNNNSMGEGPGTFLNGKSFTWSVTSGFATEVECEFSMRVPPGNVSNGDTIALKAFYSGAALEAYPSIPILTVVKGGLRISGGTLPLRGGIVTIRNNS